MMKKLVAILIMCSTISCTYKPIVDHRGNKGEEVAYRYNDDLQTCKAIGKDNTNSIIESVKVGYNWYIRPQLLWLPDKMEYSYKGIVNKCLIQRGHSIL
tara:strand:- start:2783 stop:3079 length:297 start_codon:yes stop_codon:yes gene_type:complete